MLSIFNFLHILSQYNKENFKILEKNNNCIIKLVTVTFELFKLKKETNNYENLIKIFKKKKLIYDTNRNN